MLIFCILFTTVVFSSISMALASFSDFLTRSNSSFDWLVHFLLPYVFTPYRSICFLNQSCLSVPCKCYEARANGVDTWSFLTGPLTGLPLYTSDEESELTDFQPQKHVTRVNTSSTWVINHPRHCQPQEFRRIPGSSRHSAYVNSLSSATTTSFSNSIARNFANVNAIPSGLLPLSYTPTLSHTPHFVTLPLLPSTICAPDGPDPIPPSHRVSPPSSSSPQHYSYAGVYPHDAPPLL